MRTCCAPSLRTWGSSLPWFSRGSVYEYGWNSAPKPVKPPSCELVGRFGRAAPVCAGALGSGAAERLIRRARRDLLLLHLVRELQHHRDVGIARRGGRGLDLGVARRIGERTAIGRGPARSFEIIHRVGHTPLR
jgi:hypothetical protein